MPEPRFVPGLTRDRVQVAIDEVIPFETKMADGRKHRVTDAYQIALGSTYVMVVDEKDLPHVLPLLTMTGISYLQRGRSRR